ncbi:hypothetical protein [Streptomyces sp. NPDC000410]|uniref:hypothetical protein n=1 Tax=Streptomyces sp. NPDC000410 TaxID=3154254 RepID=UPI00332F4E64
MTLSAAALNTGLDSFLAWADEERGTPLPARPADAVLTMLALRGADRRAGVPEPTPQLLRRVLHEDLPLLLTTTGPELAATGDVLAALADHVRAAGRLNAKRHARLVAAVQEALPEFERAMGDPLNLTWPRRYAALLRADGVDADDPDAVRGWLDAYARTPHAERPALPEAVSRFDVAGRTFAARALLTEALLAAYARDVDKPSPAGRLLTGPPLGGSHADDLERIATEIGDAWTAAGLNDALADQHADLAPGPEALPHFVLADVLLGEHLDYYGDSAIPLPPPPALPAPDEIRALLHAAPVPAALAAATEGDELRPLAERCGFPGPAATVWTDGTPQELTELGADILAAVIERIPGVSDPEQEYALGAGHILYTLYERGCTPASIARTASALTELKVSPDLEDAPVPAPAPGPAAPPPAPYTTPSPAELSTLLGVPALTDADRTDLDAHARALAEVVDQLAGTGCVFRTGDTYGLTPLGSAVVRHTLHAARVATPDAATAATWDATGTIAAVRYWPPQIAAATLSAWAAAHGGTDAAWTELLAAVSAAMSADFHDTPTPALFARLDLAAIPTTALRAALPDPLTGAHAHRVLQSRGEATPEDPVPLTARAALLLEDLDLRRMDDMRAYVEAATADREPAPAPTALLDAFDTAATSWPGGASTLLPALAQADPAGALRILEDLAHRHPDRHVADMAAHAAKRAQSSVKR